MLKLETREVVEETIKNLCDYIDEGINCKLNSEELAPLINSVANLISSLNEK